MGCKTSTTGKKQFVTFDFSFLKVFENVSDPTDLEIFEQTRRGPEKQECHTLEAVKLVEHDLKSTLLGVAHTLFGKGERDTTW